MHMKRLRPLEFMIAALLASAAHLAACTPVFSFSVYNDASIIDDESTIYGYTVPRTPVRSAAVFIPTMKQSLPSMTRMGRCWEIRRCRVSPRRSARRWTACQGSTNPAEQGWPIVLACKAISGAAEQSTTSPPPALRRLPYHPQRRLIWRPASRTIFLHTRPASELWRVCRSDPEIRTGL